MNNIMLANCALGTYFTAVFFGSVTMPLQKKWVARALIGLVAVGLALNLAAMTSRWFEAGRPPFSNMYESLVTFSACTAAIYLSIVHRYRSKITGVLAALFSAIGLAYASTFDANITPIMPALKSNWLTIHVAFCFLGYAAFAIAFGAAALYLMAVRIPLLQPYAEGIDALEFRSVAIGFLFLDLGIICGAVWANQAWGTYWSWDPKETWSLITFLIYGIYLHGRLIKGWTRNRLAWISIFGFMAVIMTYIGVNYLVKFSGGLHSYA